MMEALVSVIIPTYKRANMLQRAIDSVLNQTYKNIQVIVVDDNNPDSEYRIKTSQLMEKYANDERVKYICHEINKNGSAARNTGFKNCIGTYICYLDDDDYFLPEKIMQQVVYLNQHTEYDACYCDYIKNNIQVILDPKDNFTEDILLLNQTPQTSGIMFRRSCIEELNGFDERFIRHQDYELLLRFFEHKFKLGKINDYLYVRDVAKDSNIPSGKKLLEVKRFFLSEFEHIIDNINMNHRGFKKKVYTRHYIEVSKCFYKDKDAKNTIKYLSKSFFISPVTFFQYIIKKVSIRIKNKNVKSTERL